MRSVTIQKSNVINISAAVEPIRVKLAAVAEAVEDGRFSTGIARIAERFAYSHPFCPLRQFLKAHDDLEWSVRNPLWWASMGAK